MYTVFCKFGTKFGGPTATGKIPVNNTAGTNWGFLGLYFAYEESRPKFRPQFCWDRLRAAEARIFMHFGKRLPTYAHMNMHSCLNALYWRPYPSLEASSAILRAVSRA